MNIFRTKGTQMLDDQIERLVDQLACTPVVSPDYAVIADNLNRLMETREKKHPREISSETVLAVAVNLVMLVAVLNYEQTNVITSKAFGWLKLNK